jgi:hypothetical protein
MTAVARPLVAKREFDGQAASTLAVVVSPEEGAGDLKRA